MSVTWTDSPSEDGFDAFAFLKDGFEAGIVPAVIADRVLSKVRDLPFELIGSDMGTTRAREIARLDVSTPGGRFVHGVFASILREDMAALCEWYGVWDDPSTITVLRLGEGYHLDWHNHLRSGGAASLLLYLFDEDEGEGGELQLGTVIGREMETIVPCCEIKPVHGSLVVLGDGSHPLNKHRAREWRGKGHRYIVSFAYNARDW